MAKRSPHSFPDSEQHQPKTTTTISTITSTAAALTKKESTLSSSSPLSTSYSTRYYPSSFTFFTRIYKQSILSANFQTTNPILSWARVLQYPLLFDLLIVTFKWSLSVLQIQIRFSCLLESHDPRLGPRLNRPRIKHPPTTITRTRLPSCHRQSTNAKLDSVRQVLQILLHDQVLSVVSLKDKG